MNREQLAHVLRAASGIVDDPDILVIGSQSLLASYDEDELPLTATASMEVDAQAVSVRTAVLPNGWRDRVVHWSNNSTGRARRFSRTARLRGVQARRLPRQGPAFAQALLHAQLIDISTLRSRVDTLPAYVDPRVTRQLHSWLDAQEQQ